MAVYYYFTVFPNEALIASQLEPHKFGPYMATGSRKSSAEKIIYAQIKQFESDSFDWEYAHQRCRHHEDGSPKHSVYLAIYRVLENLPLTSFLDLYLTTPDGRTLALDAEAYTSTNHQEFYIYKELCPVAPLVLSKLDPTEFPATVTAAENKTWIPKIMYADLNLDFFQNPDDEHCEFGLYSHGPEHIRTCIDEIALKEKKTNKILSRSYSESFSYQLINRGVFIGDGTDLLFYRMKDETELRQNYRDWARSAHFI
jgi:hypothetical protein